MTYQIIDSQTGKIVATARNGTEAYQKADKRDAAYGACRTIIKPVRQ